MMLTMRKGNTLSHGVITKIASAYRKSSRTVARIWTEVRRALESKLDPLAAVVLNHGPKARKKKKSKYKMEEIRKKIEATPLHKRQTYRSCSEAVNVPKSSLHWVITNNTGKGAKIFKVQSVSTQPVLTDKHKEDRKTYCKTRVKDTKDTNTDTNTNTGTFIDMYDYIHVDEKWFFIARKAMKFIMTVNEEPPLITTWDKNNITKVMFLCAVGRPRMLSDGSFWNGKIGMFPITAKEPAKRSSKNRPKGTLVTTCPKLNGARFYKLMTEQLIPAIRDNAPDCMKEYPILLQLDNAPPHRILKTKCEEFAAHCRDYALIVLPLFQPANSPDLNVLDLGLFRSLQSHQFSNEAKHNIDDLIEQVLTVFDQYDGKLINDAFLTLQSCMAMVIANNGGNHYKIPHVGKAKMKELPRAFQLSDIIGDNTDENNTDENNTDENNTDENNTNTL